MDGGTLRRINTQALAEGMESIERFEKYLKAEDWVQEKDSMCWNSRDWVATEERKQFSRWFAYSDWDDPSAAWKDWQRK